MTLEDDIKTEPPCHPRACAIQDCLARNGYKESKCEEYVDALYACCDTFYKRNGDNATSASCPKASLLRLKLQQRSEAKS